MIECAKCGCEIMRCTCKTEYRKVNADDHADVPVVPEQNGAIEEIDCEFLPPTCDPKCPICGQAIQRISSDPDQWICEDCGEFSSGAWPAVDRPGGSVAKALGGYACKLKPNLIKMEGDKMDKPTEKDMTFLEWVVERFSRDQFPNERELDRVFGVVAKMLPAMDANPEDIRRAGWTVAVHNDYWQSGCLHTFWLFTKDGRAVKGEGRTDKEALAMVRQEIKKLG